MPSLVSVLFTNLGATMVGSKQSGAYGTECRATVARHSVPKAPSRSDRRGITLLEVLLSAVILAMSLAALGQLVSNGVTAGLRSERQTEAAVRCQSKLDELLAGVEPLRAVSAVPCVDDPRWLWSVE